VRAAFISGVSTGQEAEDAEDGDGLHTQAAADRQTHDHRQRNGHRDGEQTPWAVGQGFHHHQAEHRQDDRHDRQQAEHGDDADHRIDFVLEHLAERFSFASHGREKDDRVMDTAAERGTDEDPKSARQESELGGKDGTHKWTRAGDRGEVVAEDHPLVGGHIVFAIRLGYGWRGAPVVQHQHLGHEP
jgi:hypothetical protein